MKKFATLFTLLLIVATGYSQLMQYDAPKTHYVDRNNAGVVWYNSGSNANIIFGSAGQCRIQVEAYSGGIQHDYISVAVNNVYVTVLNSGSNLSYGNFFNYIKGSSLDIGVRFAGYQAACTGSFIRLKLYNVSNQLVDQMDVNFTTYSPNVVTIEPPYYVVDHKGMAFYQKVTAAQTININPGVTISPIATTSGSVDREFAIDACLQKTNGMPDVTASEEAVTRGELTVYPNPSNGQVSLDFGRLSDPDANIAIEVYSIQGKLVFQQEMNASSGANALDLSNQPKGMYMLKATVGGEVQHQQLVIQ